MKRSLFWKSLQCVAFVFTKLWFNLKVFGLENMPAEGGVLLASNHQSYLDPVLLAVRLRRPLTYMAKSQLFENKYFGWFIRSLNAFPVKQGQGDMGAIRQTIQLLGEGHVLNVYPEGHRTEDGEILPLQRGVALILRKTEVPVVPVVIDGSFQAWPKKYKFPHPHPIKVIYGKPMHFKGMPADEVIQTLQATLQSLLEELRKR